MLYSIPPCPFELGDRWPMRLGWCRVGFFLLIHATHCSSSFMACRSSRVFLSKEIHYTGVCLQPCPLPCAISPNFGSHSSKVLLSPLLSKFILFLIHEAFSSNKVMSLFPWAVTDRPHWLRRVFSTLLVVFKFLLMFLFPGGSAKLVRFKLSLWQFLAE